MSQMQKLCWTHHRHCLSLVHCSTSLTVLRHPMGIPVRKQKQMRLKHELSSASHTVYKFPSYSMPALVTIEVSFPKKGLRDSSGMLRSTSRLLEFSLRYIISVRDLIVARSSSCEYGELRQYAWTSGLLRNVRGGWMTLRVDCSEGLADVQL